MSTSLPAAPSKANSDAGTDDPKQSILTDLAAVIDWAANLLAALGALSVLDIGGGLEIETVAGGGNNDKLRAATVVNAQTGNYTAVAADRGKLIDFTLTAADATLTLTAAATLGDGWFCYVANDAGSTKNLVVDGNLAETIDGVATITVPPGAPAFMLVCDGSGFRTIGRGARQLWAEQAKTGAYVVALTDWLTVIHATSGTWTLDLPALATVPNGFAFLFRNSGAGTITADGNGAETIDGAATLAFGQSASAIFVKHATGWITIGRSAQTPILTKSFTSTQQTITSAGPLTLAHGLGEAPKMVGAKLVCTDAGGEAGYAQNDEIWMSQNMPSDFARGHRLMSDATNLLVRFGSEGSCYRIMHKTTGAVVDITNAKWKVVFLAWA